MTEVTSLNDYRPHTFGDIICLACKHNWQGVTPVGKEGFECHNCGLFRGVRAGLSGPPEGSIALVCNQCQNTYWWVLPHCLMCANCGTQGTTKIP